MRPYRLSALARAARAALTSHHRGAPREVPGMRPEATTRFRGDDTVPIAGERRVTLMQRRRGGGQQASRIGPCPSFRMPHPLQLLPTHLTSSHAISSIMLTDVMTVRCRLSMMG